MDVTPTNFQERPFSAWGFHHVRELHPTARVWRGAGPVWELPQTPGSLGDIRFEGAEGEPTTLATLMTGPYHDGLIVLHRGKLVFEAYGNGMRPQDTHILMSTTKFVILMSTSKFVILITTKSNVFNYPDVDQIKCICYPDVE